MPMKSSLLRSLKPSFRGVFRFRQYDRVQAAAEPSDVTLLDATRTSSRSFKRLESLIIQKHRSGNRRQRMLRRTDSLVHKKYLLSRSKSVRDVESLPIDLLSLNRVESTMSDNYIKKHRQLKHVDSLRIIHAKRYSRGEAELNHVPSLINRPSNASLSRTVSAVSGVRHPLTSSKSTKKSGVKVRPRVVRFWIPAPVVRKPQDRYFRILLNGSPRVSELTGFSDFQLSQTDNMSTLFGPLLTTVVKENQEELTLCRRVMVKYNRSISSLR